MNITARLQGLAKANQVLVTEEVARISNKSPDSQWEFGPEGSAPVKNVAQPLKFFPLKLE
jgi:class 3 adenylate cyclase